MAKILSKITLPFELQGGTDPIVVDMAEKDAQNFWRQRSKLKSRFLNFIKEIVREDESQFIVDIEEGEVVPALRWLAKDIGVSLGNFRVNHETKAAVANIVGVPVNLL
jgi:hypothetical protein